MKVADLLVFEATKTKTKTKAPPVDDPFLRAFGTIPGMEELPAAPRRPQPTPELRRARAERTRERMTGVTAPAGAEERLQAIHALDIQDEISDVEAMRRAGYRMGTEEPVRPRVPGTEVIVAPRSLVAISRDVEEVSNVVPEWHQVRHLPGYLQQPIRAIGRQVFGAITRTPIENIQVLANLGGSGQPNSAREINAVASWLRENGQRDTDGEINFQRAIPDYQAEFFIYKASGQTFMLVRDFAGSYIYNWPSADEKQPEGSEQRVLPQLPRRLR